MRRVVGADDRDSQETDDVVTRYTYTDEGLIETITDPLGRVTRYEYDAAGNLTAFVDENGNRAEYVYDAMDRLVEVIEADPDGTGPLRSPVTTHRYDTEGNLLLVVAPLGRATSYEYDGRDRLVATIDPEGNRTSLGYDFDDNWVSMTDARGNTTRMVYDARDRLIREVDPLGNITRYTYDAVDNLVAVEDRNGRQIEYEYDALNRLVREDWVDDPQAIAYSYDRASNLLAASDRFSTLTMTYDERERLTTIANSSDPVLLTYQYDPASNVLSVQETINGALGGTTNYEYDTRLRVEQITQSGAGVAEKRVDFAYNPLGQYETISRYSDLAGANLVVQSDYAYDGMNRLLSLVHGDESNPLAFYNYRYHLDSQIARIESVDGIADYSYDARSQLSTVTNSTLPDEFYTYDETGNRTSSSASDSYTTGDNNRLESDGVYTYQYDDEGNLVLRTAIATGEIREFVWDYRNRLVSVVDKDAGGAIVQQVEYTYDVFDRRIAKSVDADGDGEQEASVTRFVYYGENVLLEFEDGTLAHRYLHGPGIDQVLAREDLSNGEVIWHLSDHLGTVRDLVDNSGQVVNHISYDSFGKAIAQTGGVETRYLFTGREFDAETGLYYYRARYYAPELGRFLSEDPIGFDGGDVNLYRYVGNSPIQNIDPSGLETIIIIQHPHRLNPTGHAAIYVDGTVYNIGQNGLETVDPNLWGSWVRNETYVTLWDVYYTDEQEEQIKQYYENLQFGKYNLFTNNCTTNVIDSLPEGDLFSRLLQAHISPVGLDLALANYHRGLPGLFGKVRRLPLLRKPSEEAISAAEQAGNPLGFSLPDGTNVQWTNNPDSAPGIASGPSFHPGPSSLP